MEMEHPVVTSPDLQLDPNGYVAFCCSGVRDSAMLILSIYMFDGLTMNVRKNHQL